MDAQDREIASAFLKEMVDKNGLGKVLIYLLGWMQNKVSVTFDFQLWHTKEQLGEIAKETRKKLEE